MNRQHCKKYRAYIFIEAFKVDEYKVDLYGLCGGWSPVEGAPVGRSGGGRTQP